MTACLCLAFGLAAFFASRTAIDLATRRFPVERWVLSTFLWEKRRRDRWRNFREMPDFLELLAMAVSAGLNVERAWALAVAHLPESPLKATLQKSAGRFSEGRPREDTLRDLSVHLDDARIRPVFAIIIQAMKRGTPLERVLIDQAKSLRALALAAVERRAQTAPIRLLFPILLFLFPTLFIVIFGPILLQFAQHGQLF